MSQHKYKIGTLILSEADLLIGVVIGHERLEFEYMPCYLISWSVDGRQIQNIVNELYMDECVNTYKEMTKQWSMNG